MKAIFTDQDLHLKLTEKHNIFFAFDHCSTTWFGVFVPSVTSFRAPSHFSVS